MEVIIVRDAKEGSRLGAAVVARLVREKPVAVLGLATGSTPLALYGELARLHRDEGLDFSRVTTFNLDDYLGLPHEHPASVHRFMNEHLFAHVDLTAERIHMPDNDPERVPAAGAAYERAIADAGGLDLQILGLGVDGHIGFNEPGSSLGSRTRIKTLAPATLKANAYLFGGDPAQVPAHVITMGIRTILESRACLMLAFGAKKADAVAHMVEGPLTAMLPASALQLHPSVKVIVDEDAAIRLARADYYRFVYEHKPAWQRP